MLRGVRHIHIMSFTFRSIKKFKHPRVVATAVLCIMAILIAGLLVAPTAFAYESEELAFLTLINNYRQSHGLPPLTMSVSLYNASEGHSCDMGSRGYFSHNTPEGVTPWTRIRNAGYLYNTYLGENIAAGYSTAQSVFNAWAASSGHNANMLSGNYRAIGIGRCYVGGSPYGYYWTTDFGGVSEDATPPSVSVPYPTGFSLVSGIIVFKANASDNVAVTKVDMYIDGQLVYSDPTAPYIYVWSTLGLSGTHTLSAVAYDTAGLRSQADTQITIDNYTATNNYLFTWYDQSTSDWRDWVMMVNPSSGYGTARTSTLVGSYTYADREMAVGAPPEAPQFPGVVGGPVIVGSTQPLLSSQRVIYKRSFNEVQSVPHTGLESTYYFTWYDSNPAAGVGGDWILIGNQGTIDANVDVYIGGSLMGSYVVPANGRITPSYANITDGPVKVICTNGQPLMVSQRVIYKTSFNEVLGVPESKLGPEYNFTWYDSKPENGMVGNWILISNQDTGDASVDVYIGAEKMGSYTVPQGGRIEPFFEDVMAGPVKVTSTNGKRLLVSQRILFKEGFEEFQGLTPSDFGTDLCFTWYDSQPANGMYGNWIIVANQGSATANVDIYVAGSLLRHMDLLEGENVPVFFSNTMGGPVRVVSTNGQPLLATQRVIFLNSMNEIGGMQLR